jgi:hypothetical protein
MTVDPRELTGVGAFEEVARRLAAGEDLTVVEPRHAHLWTNPGRYPTAVTLVAMPSAGAAGLLIVPFLDLVGEPGDDGFDYYAGVVYVVALEDTVYTFREYQEDEGEASLLGFRMAWPVGHVEWRPCPMIPYEDPLFARAVRLLWDHRQVRAFQVLAQGYEPVDTHRLFSLDVRAAGAGGDVIRFYRVGDRYRVAPPPPADRGGAGAAGGRLSGPDPRRRPGRSLRISWIRARRAVG